jgi:hypothetical protein
MSKCGNTHTNLDDTSRHQSMADSEVRGMNHMKERSTTRPTPAGKIGGTISGEESQRRQRQGGL